MSLDARGNVYCAGQGAIWVFSSLALAFILHTISIVQAIQGKLYSSAINLVIGAFATIILEPFIREQRIIRKGGEYFYRTRECQRIGPFRTKKDAKVDLNLFVEVTRIEKDLHTMIC